MQQLQLIVVVLVEVVSVVLAAPVEYYATKYDHIDVEMILNNRRMVNYYADCMLNKGPCPPEGVAFKRILPEALRTNCERCTEKQKTVTLRAVKRLKKEYPKIWEKLQKEWDPDDVYVRLFEATYGSRDGAKIPPIQIVTPAVENVNENTISSASAFNHISTTAGPSSTTVIHVIENRFASSTSATTTTTPKPNTVKTKPTKTKSKPQPPSPPRYPLPHFGPPEIPLRINIRPIANIGQGIEATVMTVKHINKAFRNLAKEKLHQFRLFNRLMTG